MNPDKIKQNIVDHLGVSDKEVQFRTQGSHKQTEDTVVILARVGEMVTESLIEADFHQKRFEEEKAYEVSASKRTNEVLSIEEQ